MKQKIKIWNYPLIIMEFFLILGTNFSSKEDFLPNYASKIAGIYNVTLSVVGSGTTYCNSLRSKREI